MDASSFFSDIRQSIFRGPISQQQVNGINALLAGCADAGIIDRRQIAYVLATPAIETGLRYEPIIENLNYSAAGLLNTFPSRFTAAEAARYARRPQDIANRAYGGHMDNGPEASGDGWRFRGRGFVQITGRRNYTVFSKLVGVDLVGDPDKATDVNIASKIAAVGMRDGVFSGRKLADYISGDRCDYVHARAIINGTDKASEIASYATRFEHALAKAGA